MNNYNVFNHTHPLPRLFFSVPPFSLPPPPLLLAPGAGGPLRVFLTGPARAVFFIWQIQASDTMQKMSITNMRPNPTKYPIGRHVVLIATPEREFLKIHCALIFWYNWNIHVFVRKEYFRLEDFENPYQEYHRRWTSWHMLSRNTLWQAFLKKSRKKFSC